MHITIIGPGAMGCLFAAALGKAGYHVTLVDHVKERAALINREGIHVEGITGTYAVKVPVVVSIPTNSPDAVLLCVKSNQTREVATTMRTWLQKAKVLVTLQNGVGNREILSEFFGEERVLGGVTAEGATLLGPGKIRHAGKGETVIGPATRPGGHAENLASILALAGFKSRSEVRVDNLIWGKLIINVGINALTALTRLRNGRLPQIAGSRSIMEEAVSEAATVARAKGIPLPFADPMARVEEVCRLTANNIASMLQDVLRKKPTEIDFINGAIVREGKALHIPTPVNATLTALVKVIEGTYEERI
jgi:2-dehydropantoate 2-reductase